MMHVAERLESFVHRIFPSSVDIDSVQKFLGVDVPVAVTKWARLDPFNTSHWLSQT